MLALLDKVKLLVEKGRVLVAGALKALKELIDAVLKVVAP